MPAARGDRASGGVVGGGFVRSDFRAVEPAVAHACGRSACATSLARASGRGACAISIADASEVGYTTAKAAGEIERPANPDPAFDTNCHFEYVTDQQFSEHQANSQPPRGASYYPSRGYFGGF